MKIETWQQCHELRDGQLVVDAEGEIWRITKPGAAGKPGSQWFDGETWLQHFSDEYATIIRKDFSVRNDPPGVKLPLEVVQFTPGPYQALVDLGLTEDERQYLAMHARYESERQTDFRYQNRDLAKRDALLARWRQIADVLHPDPWGTAKREEAAK